MRITSGEFRGRVLKVPAGEAVRPTQDRVREALFSMLQHDLAGRTFLDLFAGSGAVGLEALSRGAVAATFVECEPRHVACIRANVETVKAGDRANVIRADAWNWIGTAGAGRRFGVAFADPPYALAAERGYADVLKTLAEKNVVAPGGLFVAEMRILQDAEEVAGWDLCRDRKYGQTRLAVYRRAAAETAEKGAAE